MSRRRKDRGDNPENIFEELTTTNTSPSDDVLGSTSAFANAAYGSQTNNPFGAIQRTSYRASNLPIDEIYPDSAQPRRVIPSSLRQYWNGQPQNLPDLFGRWLEEIRLERDGQTLDIDAILAGETTEFSQLDPDGDTLPVVEGRFGVRELALIKITELAASIQRDGLTNPITVAQRGRLYVIETGERRWLAYHLLRWRLGSLSDQDWTTIPARVVDTVDIWRQATENNARDDLNAIARTRQLALLLMDVHGIDHFRPLDVFETEQKYYAQVSDGARFSARGYAQDLLNAMGLRSSTQLRQYRQLLRLPNIVWVLADDLDWSQNFIAKNILNKAQNERDEIRLAVKLAKSQGYSVSALTVYEHLLDDENRSAKAQKSGSKLDHWRRKGLKALKKDLGNMSAGERQQLISEIRALLSELE
ncbi:MAG: ParB N-terminal domain-containing protein [Anaerolineae bacterium]|nr:ParB N-terminal domain-containing protein [Anaerolineae bacterium]